MLKILRHWAKEQSIGSKFLSIVCSPNSSKIDIYREVRFKSSVTEENAGIAEPIQTDTLH